MWRCACTSLRSEGRAGHAGCPWGGTGKKPARCLPASRCCAYTWSQGQAALSAQLLPARSMIRAAEQLKQAPGKQLTGPLVSHSPRQPCCLCWTAGERQSRTQSTRVGNGGTGPISGVNGRKERTGLSSGSEGCPGSSAAGLTPGCVHGLLQGHHPRMLPPPATSGAAVPSESCRGTLFWSCPQQRTRRMRHHEMTRGAWLWLSILESGKWVTEISRQQTSVLQGEAEPELHGVWGSYYLNKRYVQWHANQTQHRASLHGRQERDTISCGNTQSTLMMLKCRNTSINHAVWCQWNSLIKFSTDLVLTQILLKLELTAAPQAKALLYIQVWTQTTAFCPCILLNKAKLFLTCCKME